MSNVVAPDRSLSQRRAALETANEVRVARAAWKRRLRAGDERIEEALANPPPWLRSASVSGVLRTVPGVGKVRANWIMQRLRIAGSKTVGGLTPRQRRDLVELLLSRNGDR